MINPHARALRRRCDDLSASAERERAHDTDSAALLLFYAAECGLKSVYMIQNNLKYASEERGQAASARSFAHNISRLIMALNISRSSIDSPPVVVVERSGMRGDIAVLHEACRYGEKIKDTALIYQWLMSVIEWCRNNR